MAEEAHIQISGTGTPDWRQATEIYIQISGTGTPDWRQVTEGYIQISGTGTPDWKQFFASGAYTTPTGFAMDQEDEDSVRTGWVDASTAEDEFEVRSDPAETLLRTEPSTTKVGTGTQYYWIRTGLTEGTDYPMKVRAGATGGPFGAYSSVVTGKTKLLAPTSASVSVLSSTSLRVSWTVNSTREQQIRVERCVGVGCSSFSFLINKAADVTSHDDTGLTEGNTYRYQIKNQRTDGAGQDSDYSNIATGVPEDPLAAPTTVLNITIRWDRLTFRWDDNSIAETKWEVEKDTVWYADKTSTTTATKATLYTQLITGLSENTSYSIRCRASDGAATGPYSATDTDTTLLREPSSLGATPGPEEIQLNWTRGSTQNTNVDIWRCTGASCTNFAFLIEVGQVTSYLNTGLTGGTVYRYKVKNTKSGAPDSLFSNIATATAQQATAPVLVSVVKTPGDGNPGTCGLTCNWDDNSPSEDNYQVWRANGTGDPFSGSNVSGDLAAGTETYLDSTVTEGGSQYTYGIRKKETGDDEDSNTITQTTGSCVT